MDPFSMVRGDLDERFFIVGEKCICGNHFHKIFFKKPYLASISKYRTINESKSLNNDLMLRFLMSIVFFREKYALSPFFLSSSWAFVRLSLKRKVILR